MSVFEQTPECRGLELRLSVAQMVIRNLKDKGWTQTELATKAGVNHRTIHMIIHSDTNATLGTIGKLLFAFGLHGMILERDAED